jgi:hypothetical protein
MGVVVIRPTRRRIVLYGHVDVHDREIYHV